MAVPTTQDVVDALTTAMKFSVVEAKDGSEYTRSVYSVKVQENSMTAGITLILTDRDSIEADAKIFSITVKDATP